MDEANKLEDLDITHALKIKAKIMHDFKLRCSTMGRKPNEIIREMMLAFNDERLVIEMNEEKINERKLYHEPRK